MPWKEAANLLYDRFLIERLRCRVGAQQGVYPTMGNEQVLSSQSTAERAVVLRRKTHIGGALAAPAGSCQDGSDSPRTWQLVEFLSAPAAIS
jgi:hypothetical protein